VLGTIIAFLIYSFILGLFKETFNRPYIMASSDRTINVRKHSWPNFGTIPVNGWKKREESHNHR